MEMEIWICFENGSISLKFFIACVEYKENKINFHFHFSFGISQITFSKFKSSQHISLMFSLLTNTQGINLNIKIVPYPSFSPVEFISVVVFYISLIATQQQSEWFRFFCFMYCLASPRTFFFLIQSFVNYIL